MSRQNNACVTDEATTPQKQNDLPWVPQALIQPQIRYILKSTPILMHWESGKQAFLCCECIFHNSDDSESSRTPLSLQGWGK